MAFTKKTLSLVFTLGTGTFGETGANQVTVQGLRISAKIVKGGNASLNECQLRIFGLTPTVYNSLASIYPVNLGIKRNTVQVTAIDGASAPSVVFEGQITLSQIDLNSQPDAVMNIIAQSALLQALAPIAATSYPSSFDVATALKTLAGTMKVDFVNCGVAAQLPKRNFPGTAWQQVRAIVDASGIGCNNIDNGKLVIWPNGGSRTDITPIPIVSYQDNMIGYPSYSSIGIGIKCLYNPNIQLGGNVMIKSSLTELPGLNGTWTAYNVIHTLESEMPDGQWMTEFQASSTAAINA